MQTDAPIATQTLKAFRATYRPPGPPPRVISNSGGATSGLMTLREMANGLGPNDYVIFCNTGLEREETLEFLHQQQTVLGVPVIWLEYCRYHRWKRVSFETASRKGEPFTAILADRRHWKWRPYLTETMLYANGERAHEGSREWQLYYQPERFWGVVENMGADGGDYEIPMTLWVGDRPEFEVRETQVDNPNPFGLYLPNQQTRFCTQELKIRVMRDFMRSQGHGHWVNIVGIRADEPSRHHNGKVSTDARFDVEHPLYHAGIRKADVQAFWTTQPFKLQLAGHEGNCTLCFLKGKGKLLQLLHANPELAEWWHECEVAAGVTFSKRQSYDDLSRMAQNRAQQQTLDFWPADEESISCACTD